MADTKTNGAGGVNSSADAGKTVTDQVKDKAAGVVDAVKDTARQVMDRVTDYAGQLRDKAEASGAVDAARQAGQRVQEFAGPYYDAAAGRLGDFGQDAAALVRKHPLPAVLIGFGVGLLLGRAAKVV